VALSVSALAHLALAAWVTTRSLEAPKASHAPFWMELQAERPLPPPSAFVETQPPAKTPPQRPARSTKSAPPQSNSTSAVTDDHQEQLTDDTPRAPPGSVTGLKLPTVDLNLRGGVPMEAERGQTMYPDDPRFSPEAINAEAKARVTARVQGFAEDELASCRAQRGLPHPWFGKVTDVIREGLSKLAFAENVGPTGEALIKAYVKRYESAAARYGRKGDPELGPPGQAPRPSELLKLPELQALRALAQATETTSDLTSGKPLRSLTLQLLQPKGGEAATITILEGSGDPVFDDLVLRGWRALLTSAGPPPDEVFHGEVQRSIWEIEGWQRTKVSAANDFVPGLMGVSSAKVLGLARGEGYDFRAKLLRAY
jgi:hypothetical protein